MRSVKTLLEWTANMAVITLILLAAFVLISTILLNWQFNPVMSGSMAPTLKVGGIVVSETVDPVTIEVGDIIIYRSPQMDITVVHRVIEKREGDNLLFQTQGDANRSPDPQLVSAGNVLARVSFHMPFLGRVQNSIISGQGMLLLTVVPGLLIVVKAVRNMQSEISRWRHGRAPVAIEKAATDQEWSTGLRKHDWLIS